MRRLARMVQIAAMLILPSGMAHSDAIRVLSVGAVQNVLTALAAEFSKETGHTVDLAIAAPAALTQKIKAGDVRDAVIVSEGAMDQLDGEGMVNPESRVALARTGLGVAVRESAPSPDLSTPEAFKQALLAAQSIVYGDPTLANQSGAKAEQVLKKAGLFETLRPKLRIVPGGAASREMIAKGEVEMGLYNAVEIAEGKGVKVAGVVPAPWQIDTRYEAAVMSDGSAPEAARAFILFLSRPEAGAKWRAAKFAPP